jgi:hypothetical protein
MHSLPALSHDRAARRGDARGFRFRERPPSQEEIMNPQSSPGRVIRNPSQPLLVVGSPSELAPEPGTDWEYLPPEELAARLDHPSAGAPAALILAVAGAEEASRLLRDLRSREKLWKTRVAVVADAWEGDPSPFLREYDVEEVLARDQAEAKGLGALGRKLLGAYQALAGAEHAPKRYLDATFNGVFDWFEGTRWHWTDLGDFSAIRKDLVRPAELELIREMAVLELGSLPGAHGFLREWENESSFSQWALSWGAEESRHSLVLCRYLRAFGIEIDSKFALYKRAPYPAGENRAGTLMMNIISESRAAEYYRRICQRAEEPLLNRIWMLLGRDEARHARAFYVFCKEATAGSERNLLEAMKMCYLCLADGGRGLRQPAGHFYAHVSSMESLRKAEDALRGATEIADANVIKMARSLTGDGSIEDIRGVKAWLRRHM